MRYKGIYNRLLLTGVAVMLLWCCKPKEAVVASDSTKALLERLENQSYRVDIHSVRPFATAATQNVVNSLLLPNTGNSATRIDVQGNGHYLKFNQEQMQGDFPFFGEQRQGGGHFGQANSGIALDDKPKDYKVAMHKRKQAIVMTFEIDDANRNTEHYDGIITVFSNQNALIQLYSSHRTSMEYAGKVSFIEID